MELTSEIVPLQIPATQFVPSFIVAGENPNKPEFNAKQDWPNEIKMECTMQSGQADAR